MDLDRHPVPASPGHRGAAWPREALLVAAAAALMASAILAATPGVGREAHAASSAQLVPTPTSPPLNKAPGGSQVIVIPTATRTPTRPPLTVRDPVLPRDLTVVAATPRVIILLPTATPTPHRHWPHYPPDGYYPTPTPTPTP